MTDEITIIKKDVDQFLVKNRENFEIMKEFHDQVVNLTQLNFPETIKLIKDHIHIFFNSHETTMSFLYYIIRASLFNFKKVELVLDICVSFKDEIRNTVSDFEILSIFVTYHLSINYLFSKQFFPIESIIQKGIHHDLLFINFLPEIEEYDPELAKKRVSGILQNSRNSMVKNLYEIVQKDPQEHVINRSKLYHPSTLHKSIREDDIETFQSLLYKNNYNVNSVIDFSIYERTQTVDSDLSLIQVAATYGAIKIFKFLWIQADIKPPKNILLYAFFGGNNEIIHLCEEKFPDKKAILQTIYLNRLDFLDYYIENFSNQLEETNEDVKNALKKFEIKEDEESDTFYMDLNVEQLYAAIDYYTVPVIQSTLPKICFIIRNIELDNVLSQNLKEKLLEAALFHINLFEFFFTQRDPSKDPKDCDAYFQCLDKAVLYLAFDAFKFLFNKLNGNINYYEIFSDSIYYSNLMVTNYLLDLQIDELEKDTKNTPVYSDIANSISINLLINQILIYDEEITVKMIKLYNFFDNNENVSLFVNYLEKNVTTKMILNLFKKIIPLLDNDVLEQMADEFINLNDDVANFIKDHLHNDAK